MESIGERGGGAANFNTTHWTDLLKLAETKYIAAEEIASVYVALGENDEAFKGLNRACDDHGGAIQAIPIRPVFKALHSDPRFREIVQRIGLDPALVLDR